MSYVVLTGALKNVGDYLIADRAINLIKHHKPSAQIIEISRYEELDNRLDEINNSNAVILAGGPGYRYNMYPEIFKLTKNLDDIKVPIVCMGMGQRSFPGDDESIYKYEYSEKSKELLKRSSKDFYLGCRDYLTSRTLKHNGLDNVLMTGCVAWYDMEYINKEYSIDSKVNSIVFSNPAEIRNINQSIQVIKLIKSKYPNAKLYCAFHRGIEADKFTNEEEAKATMKLKREAEILGYEILDLSHNLDGMKIYDETDLHIGYRVHAHIYCMSHFRKSILIEEDARGRGVNEAMGLYGINARQRKYSLPCLSSKIKNKIIKKIFNRTEDNNYAINNLSNYIDELEANEYRDLESAYMRIKNTYKQMQKFINKLP